MTKYFRLTICMNAHHAMKVNILMGFSALFRLFPPQRQQIKYLSIQMYFPLVSIYFFCHFFNLTQIERHWQNGRKQNKNKDKCLKSFEMIEMCMLMCLIHKQCAHKFTRTSYQWHTKIHSESNTHITYIITI